MRQSREFPGTYLPSAPLLAVFNSDATSELIAERLGVARATVTAWKQGRRIKWRDADNHAIRLGLHPVSIWGDEWFLGVIRGPRIREKNNG